MKIKIYLSLISALFALTFFTFNFFNLPVAEASNLNAQNVIWTNAVGMNVSGNNLSKTAINNWGNGGASSVQQIISGDGYVEFTTNETNTTKFAGLSKGDPNQDYKQINFALGLNAFGQIYISENTVLKYGPAGSYIPGDIFKVAVESGVVKYYKNGTIFYTSSQVPLYPLIFDTSLHHTGTTVTNAKIFSNTQNITWASVVGVNANGNNLTKTAVNNWGNGGASSVQQIISGDGYVEFSTNEINTAKVGGLSNGVGDLSNGDLNQEYTSINFGLGLTPSGQVYIVEIAALKYGPTGNYVPGDIFKVAVESGVVKYYQNGNLLYTSSERLTYPLLFDTAFHHIGSTITNAKISGANISTLPPAFLTLEANDPILPDATEESIFMNGSQCDNWYHDTSDGMIYYAFANNSNCSNWVIGNNGAPILTGVSAPYVIKVDTTYYLAAVKDSDGSVYLWSSTDKITWTPANGGNKIFTKSATNTDWNYNLGNPSIAVIGSTWHFLMEGKNGIGGNYETHYSKSTLAEGPNFNTNMTANTVLPSPSGNTFLLYVPNRNALLAVYGDWGGPKWRIRASSALLSTDLSKSSSWVAAPGFRWLQKAGVHLADPTLVFADNKDWKVMLAYNYAQSQGYRAYGQLNIDQLYDLVTTPTIPEPTPTPTPFTCNSGLLVNGCFEDLTNLFTNWACGGSVSGKCIVDSTVAHSGKNSIKIANTGYSWGWQIAQAGIPTSAGETFCLSGWVKKGYYNSWTPLAVQEVGGSWRSFEFNTPNGLGWQQIKQSVTIPVDWQRNIQVYARSYWIDTNWYDDLSLTRGSCQ